MNINIKQYVNDLLDNKKNCVILEIGSHYGEDTIELINIFDNPKIYCFEPHPNNLAFMKKTFTSNSNIKIFPLAVCDKDGFEDFYMINSPLLDKRSIPDKYKWIGSDYLDLNLNDSGGSSLKYGYRNNDTKKIKVETISLDSWSKQQKVYEVDFMWIDVQGSEKEVVAGGKKILSNTKYVWIEYGEIFYDGGMNKEETIILFESIGFIPIKDDGFNLLFKKI